MKIQYNIPSALVVAVCCCSVASARVDPPTLCKGAVITISGGQQRMTSGELRAYRKMYRQDPPPFSITVKMGESFKVGNTECYLPGCGISPASVDNLDNPEVDCIIYRPSVGSAELLLDVTSDTGRTRPRFFLRRELTRSDSIQAGTGLGSGAWVEFQKKEGNTWHGTIRGFLYNVSNPQGIVWMFGNSPITITLPAEGEDWSHIAAVASEAEQEGEEEATVEGEQPAATPPALTDDAVCEIIRKRLQLMVNNPVDEKLVNELYAENVTRLSDGQSVSRNQLLENARNLVRKWPRRGVNLLAVGRNDYQIELLTVFSYSNNTGKEISGYSKLTLSLDNEGKIIAMNEEITENKGQLSDNMKPFNYKGETSFITID